MSNIENTDETNVTFRRTQTQYENSISLSIPLELAKELYVENSKVSISLKYDRKG